MKGILFSWVVCAANDRDEADMMQEYTVAEMLDRYDREILPTKASTTAYQQRLVHAWICEELGHITLEHLTPMVLRTWMRALEKRLAAGTVRRYLDSLSGPLTVAWQEWNWIAENPLRKVRRPPASPGRTRFLTPEERDKLLLACQQSRCVGLPTFVLLALATGARKSELRGLRWEDVDLTQGLLKFPHTKNGEERWVPLVPLALEALRTWHARRVLAVGWVFPRADGQQPLDFDTAFKNAVARAGVAAFRFHDLRHSCASWLLMSGASPVEAALILGHKSMQMLKRYSHMSEGHTRTVLQRMAAAFLPGGDVADDVPPC